MNTLRSFSVFLPVFKLGIAVRLVHLSSFHFSHTYSSRESNKVKGKLVNLEASWAQQVCKLMMYFSCTPPKV